MTIIFKLRKLIMTGVLLALASYYLHKPLPETLTQRRKLQFLEPFMRLVYFYPQKAFGYLGVSWQVMWTRNTLNFFGHLVNWVTYHEPGVKQTYDVNFADNVPVRVYIPEKRKNDGAILFIHGGGFVLMNVASYDSFVRELVRKTGMVAVSIDYRLAPEHVFPAGLDDCERAVTSFLTDHYKTYNVDPSKVVLMGDSAGGNLAAVVALRLRDKKHLPSLKLQVLIYPFLQMADMLTPSYQFIHRTVHGTAMLDPESLARWMLVYLGIDTAHVTTLLKNNHTTPESRRSLHFDHLDHNILPAKYKREFLYAKPPSAYGDPVLSKALEPYLFNADVSPIMSPSLSGLPKSLVITCEFDPLRDEGYWYTERMRKEGVEADLIHYDEGFHAMLNFYSEIDLGRKAFVDIANYIHKNIEF